MLIWGERMFNGPAPYFRIHKSDIQENLENNKYIQ